MNIDQSQMLPMGTVLHAGSYRVEAYLSSGGFGNTYVVTHQLFEERMAMKEFFMKGICQRDGDTGVSISNADNSAQFDAQREKFKKEARRLHRLHHPNLMQVHDLFEENGTAYYVMDYVDGESLADRLKRQGHPLSEAELHQMLPQVLNALDAVHQQQIYHLDLKPANIMVERQGRVVLIDFGASKQLDAKGGHTGTSTALCYTPGYALTEQVDGDYSRIGPWTDFYALGATIYNLLSGQTPPSTTDMMNDGDEAFHFPATMSPGMREVVTWCMAPAYKRRPGSVAEIGERLAALVASPQRVPEAQPTRLGVPPPPPPSPAPLPGAATQLPGAAARQPGLASSQPGAAAPPPGAAPTPFPSPMAGLIYEEEAEQEEMKDNNAVENLLKDMVTVKGGTFLMGDADGCPPLHPVTVSTFAIGRFPVTQDLWQAVMGQNPSTFKGARRPVETVSWIDCQEFIRRLNMLTGRRFRLPTEAEWEFAARGGKLSRGYTYSGSERLDDVGWYYGNSSSDRTHDVGLKQPNELGLYDMSGNVWEWCLDCHMPYSAMGAVDPVVSEGSYRRVNRGGSWDYDENGCRVYSRDSESPGQRLNALGLRLACDVA